MTASWPPTSRIKGPVSTGNQGAKCPGGVAEDGNCVYAPPGRRNWFPNQEQSAVAGRVGVERASAATWATPRLSRIQRLPDLNSRLSKDGLLLTCLFPRLLTCEIGSRPLYQLADPLPPATMFLTKSVLLQSLLVAQATSLGNQHVLDAKQQDP